jgi:hypothetical protein
MVNNLEGSDVHVMLVLYRSSRQVVMTDEHLDGTNMMSEFLGEGQRLTHQAGYPLAQGVVEPLDVIGFPSSFADGFVLSSRNHPFVHPILVGVKCGVLTIGLRNLGPQSPGTFAAAIPHMKGNPLARRGIHGNPYPLLVGPLLHKALHIVGFYF